MEGWTGWMDGQMEGWTDGWMNGWSDLWTGRCIDWLIDGWVNEVID